MLPLAGLVAGGIAHAQEAVSTAAPALEEVVVTATGTNISGVAPVGVKTLEISRDDILATGKSNIAEVVRTLPQMQNLGFDEAARDNSNANQTGNATRGTSLNLRGIGTSATLVLVDGHRLTPAGVFSTFFEAIQVPTAAVERIEVVPDGASAIYGSDAISGVVNYVLRKDFQGVELSGRYGSNDYGSDWTGSAVAGAAWDSVGPLGHGNVMLSYEHYRQNPVLRGQLPWYRQDLTAFGGIDNRIINNDATPGSPGNIRVGNQPRNTTLPAAGTNTYYGIPTTVANPNGVPTQAEILGRLNQPNLVDRADFEDYTPLTERDQVALFFDQDIGERLGVFYEGFYTKRDTITRTFQPFNAGATVSIAVSPGTPYYISDPTLPAGAGNPTLGTAAFPGAPLQEQVQYNLLAHVPEGVRFVNNTPEETFSHTAGLRLKLAAEWKAELHYTYGTVDNCGVCYEGFFVNNDAGNALTRAVNEGFINPYSSARLTAAQWDRIRGDNVQRTQNRTNDSVLKFDGPLFTLPGGRLRTAVGVEYSKLKNRLQNGATRAPSFTNSPVIPGAPDKFVLDAQADEGRTQKAAFAEVYVPIVGASNAMPLVRALNLSAAFRYDDYSDFGNATNPKLGFTWDLTDAFSLRGSWGTAFRAPTLPELNNGLFSVSIAFPTQNNSGDPRIPVQIPLPGNPLTTVLVRLGGNPDLTAEEAETWTTGFDFKPQFLEGLRVASTYYSIKYKNRIQGLPWATFLVNPQNRAVYDPLITVVAPEPGCVPGNLATAAPAVRDALTNPPIPTTSVAGLPGLGPRSFLYGIENISSANLCDVRAILDGRSVNSAKTKQRGVDLSVNYSFDALASFWNAGVAATKILSNDEQIFAGAAVNNALDRINFPVDPRIRTTLTWSRGPLSATLFGNYVGSYTNDTPITVAGVVQPNTRVPSWFTTDLNLTYRTPQSAAIPFIEDVRLSITAQNLFDRDPPVVLTGSTANDARNHNPLGRALQFGFTKQF